MNMRTPLFAAVAALALTLAACGDTTRDAGDRNTTTTSVAPGVPPDDPPTGDQFPVEQARQDAAAVLGMNESDLPADVRIARRGDEVFALTEDYVPGRITVELDDDGDGYRVVTSTVELPEGPETLELTPS